MINSDRRGLSGRRSLLDLYADILAACSRPERITRITLKAGLNYPQAARHLESLEALGLISRNSSNGVTRYSATGLGLRFLRHYSRMIALLAGSESRESSMNDELYRLLESLSSKEEPQLLEGVRGIYDLCTCMLLSALDGSGYSIMGRNCSLNYFQLRRYAAMLIDRGLLEKKGFDTRGRPVFQTTDNGLEFLANYAAIKMLLGGNNSRLES